MKIKVNTKTVIKVLQIVLLVGMVVYFTLSICNMSVKIKETFTPKYHYQFVSSVLKVDDDNTYAVVSDDGHIFTFKSDLNISDENEYLITMTDNGTTYNIDDEIVEIEIPFDKD